MALIFSNSYPRSYDYGPASCQSAPWRWMAKSEIYSALNDITQLADYVLYLTEIYVQIPLCLYIFESLPAHHLGWRILIRPWMMSPLVLIFPQRSVMGVSSYWVVLSCKECAQPGLATPVINGLMSLSADFTNQNRTATCFSSGPPSRLRTEKCTRTHILQVRLLQIVFEIYVYYDAPSMRLHEPKGFSRKNMYSLLEQTRHSMI